jgi:hypothetical protein
MGYRQPKLKEETQDLLTDFCQNPPLAIFSGHLHYSRDYYYQCDNGRQLKMINVGSVNSQRNWQLPRFLKVKVLGNGEVKIEEILL